MQTLSRKLLQLSPFRANQRVRDELLESAPLLGADGTDAADPGGGFRLKGKAERAVVLERKSFTTVALALTIYIAAAFLANEWLYLLACGLVVVVIAGAILPALMVATLTADCWLPSNAVADESSEIVVEVKQSTKYKILSWLVPIDCLRTRILLARRTPQGYAIEQTVSKQPVLLENVLHEARLNLMVPLLERGVYKLANIEVSTSFPFGMAWAIRSLKPRNQLQNSIVVFPHVHSLNGAFLLDLRGQLSSMGISFTETLALTQSTSVRSIRDFRVGDSLRHIHWASSARLGKMLVREFDSETLPVFDIYLDLCANWRNRQQFELAISLVASLINFGYDHDILPELHLNPPLDHPDMAPLMCDLPSARAPLDSMMHILARVEPLPYRSSPVGGELSPNRELLSMIPSADVLVRSTAQGRDSVSMPIQLVSVNRKEPSLIAQNVHPVIATIYGECDLEAL